MNMKDDCMLFYGEFKQEILKMFQIALPDATVMVNEDDCMVMVKEAENNSSSYRYPLMQLYDIYRQNEMPIHSLVDALIIYTERTSIPDGIRAEDFIDYSFVKDRLRLRMVNLKDNQEDLKNKPYKSFLDLAVVFEVLIKQYDDCEARVIVDDDLFEQWNVSIDEMYQSALKNTQRVMPAIFSKHNLSPDYLYSLTNEYGVYGSVCLLFEDVLQDIAGQLDNDFLIYPGVHELVIIPYRKAISYDFIRDLSLAVNHMGELLSNRTYRFQRETGNVEVICIDEPGNMSYKETAE